MTERPQYDERIWREAMEHVLAVRSGRADASVRQAAARWREADSSHDSAFHEADEVWRIAGALPPVHDGRWARRRPVLFTRRRLLAGGGALAAGIAALAVLPPALERMEGGERTASGEVRVLDFAEGSCVTLGPDSLVHVEIGDRERRVVLVRGVAYFNVMPDPQRPFVVASEGLTARVLGTAFEVRSRGDNLSVSVSHGRVEVLNSRPPVLAAEQLGAGDWLALRRGEGTVERGRAAADRIAGWRDGMIVVERRPVSTVVAEIAPWYDGRIFFLDSDLGARLVSGVYDLGDPATALEAVVSPFGGRVRRVTPWLLVVTSG